MKKFLVPVLAMAFALVLAPTASAIFYTCEDCGGPSLGKCVARSGPCTGNVVTCFEWFTLCTGELLQPSVDAFESKEAFLLSLETQAMPVVPAKMVEVEEEMAR